ncbi:hypothetical protein [Bosea vaviloviae]|uniref:Uncharacterized protein n=1 Tax=Bosea vaviloviae TaxID=1526658 RepID=A0A1D7U4A2_9HYPH|nr:hypothetical protein [Bosea vaviloviae]AOO82194.1 hypothetical protein BHK69_18675 [Bosea vaviloviae]
MNQQSIHDRIMSRQQGYRSSDAVIEPRRSWVKVALYAVIGITALGGVAYGSMNFASIRGLISQPAIAETNKTDRSRPETPFLQHARQAGLKSCSTVFPVLGELLTNGAKYDVQSSWNNQSADSHAVQALVGMSYTTQAYSGPAAGVVFAAPTQSTCEGTMVRVAPFSASCAEIPAVLPQGSKLASNLGQIAVYALANNGGNALLLPTGTGCVVVSVASAARQ